MSQAAASRTTSRRIPRVLVAGLLAATASIAANLGYPWLVSTSFSAAPESPSPAASFTQVPRSERRDALGEVDGVVPTDTTVFDDEIPGVVNLDPALLSALRQAAVGAADDGIELFVNSGWRSPEYQEQLLRAAVSKYGSQKKAARWVGTPITSAHVSGEAVDIGPFSATAWLSEHGATYGLCQIYRNEPWHYELRPEATHGSCPPMYADPTRDPRMQGQ